jgi:hypothetical protein
VKARTRDAAFYMHDAGMPVNAELVKALEAFLRAKYASQDAFQHARERWEEARRNIVPARPSIEALLQKHGKAVQADLYYQGKGPHPLAGMCSYQQ